MVSVLNHTERPSYLLLHHINISNSTFTVSFAYCCTYFVFFMLKKPEPIPELWYRTQVMLNLLNRTTQLNPFILGYTRNPVVFGGAGQSTGFCCNFCCRKQIIPNYVGGVALCGFKLHLS